MRAINQKIKKLTPKYNPNPVNLCITDIIIDIVGHISANEVKGDVDQAFFNIIHNY